jgi:hypothetical protein
MEDSMNRQRGRLISRRELSVATRRSATIPAFRTFERGEFMLYRFCGLLACLVALSTVTSAQNEPFFGTWELNLSRSSITRGGPPKGETIVNVAEPGGFKSTLTVVGERGTNVEIHHFNFDGEFHRTEGSDPRELSFKRLGPNAIEQQTRRNGQITVTRRIELSPDGKTMTYIASGSSGGGQKYTNDTRVYERK